MNTYSIDFETFYSKDLSVTDQGIWHYLRSPDSDIYMISIAGDDGYRFVGAPKDADWGRMLATPPTFLSHNAGFDIPCFLRLQELGHVPEKIRIAAWHDTADLVAFLGIPRSLKSAVSILLGVELDKDTRDKMKGRKWLDMTPEFKAEVERYALADAEYCLRIWQEFSQYWPEKERQISRMTREMAYRGVPLDKAALESAKEKLEVAVWEAETLIPWAKTSPILSLPAARAECIKCGIPAPESFAEKSPEAEEWENKYADQVPWIRALRAYRKANKHLKTVCTMLERLRPDGYMAYGLKYFGAHTGRDSGDSGWNAQNLPRGEVCGVDLRAMIKAPEGRTFIIADLSAIEPRVLAWLVQDHETMRLLAAGMDVYEAHARATMNYVDWRPLKEVDSELRKLAKARVLGLGYGCGADKFQLVAKMLAGLEISAADSATTVAKFRASNRKIVDLWGHFDAQLRKTALSDSETDFCAELPSGRVLRYRAVSPNSRGCSALLPRNGQLMRLGVYGGLITENCTQAVARDVFMEQCLTLHKMGLSPCLRIHDEVVIEVDEKTARQSLETVLKVMSTPPEWMPGLPLAADGQISNVYKK